MFASLMTLWLWLADQPVAAVVVLAVTVSSVVVLNRLTMVRDHQGIP